MERQFEQVSLIERKGTFGKKKEMRFLLRKNPRDFHPNGFRWKVRYEVLGKTSSYFFFGWQARLNFERIEFVESMFMIE